MSQFGFLNPEWPDIHNAARRAEAHALGDPNASAVHARRTLELIAAWLYKYDSRLKRPYDTALSSLIHEPTFRTVAGETILAKARFIKDTGNQAAHGDKNLSQGQSAAAVKELFHVAFWLATTYARGVKPAGSLAFEAAKLPRPAAEYVRLSAAQIRKLEDELHARDEELAKSQAAQAEADAELARLRAELASVIKANAATPDTHDYNEAETRDRLVDLLLREAGWNPEAPNTVEFRLTMPDGSAGRADYVLWGDDGKPLAVVEAKRTRHAPQRGQDQARLYADALQAAHGQRPIIFYSNGYEHWIWDDTNYPPRPVAGFYKKSELALLIQRRAIRRPLADAAPDETIVERYYQHRALRRIAEHFERDNERRALIVMATGAGKTRTVIALAELLMRCNWAKRILFLADRIALVNQAVGAFKQHLPSSAPVNLVTEKAAEGRVYVSTYPTMMGLLEDQDGAQRRFGIGHFDLVVVDEAHRSIYKKYGAIFEYFDSLLVGLTATPKDEIDRNTYRLFRLETGMPTDAYPMEDAVKDQYLVPMRGISVPTKFQRGGITYDQLSEEERADWDDIDWGDNEKPDRVDSAALNGWLFNADTVDQVVAYLMTNGQHVQSGDRLGKTIIFARNHDHAAFIQQRFDVAYSNLKGVFARVIDNTVVNALGLIDEFSKPNNAPHIAISVDMMDTGIDVPEIVNLVFFKPVRSKTKFWQMIGRGTRLRPDLFGPGQDKEFFTVFDFCENLEFFRENPPTVDGSTGESLSSRLFRTRLALIGVIDDSIAANGPKQDAPLRDDLATILRDAVASMNPENVIVRPQRRMIEKFTPAEAWTTLSADTRRELASALSAMPTGQPPEGLEAKQFDLLILTLQLGVYGAVPNFPKLRARLEEIATALSETSVPPIRMQLPLIEDILTDEWWQDITAGTLETTRRALRGLIHLIEKRKRRIIYTDFRDDIGDGVAIPFDAFAPLDAFEKFRAKARYFMRQHQDHIAVVKLRSNRQLTPTDLEELEHMLQNNGIGSPDDIAKAKADAPGLGLFVRSLIGLDRAAAKEAFATFLSGRALTSNQLEFINLLVDHLTENGAMQPSRLYESPYTDLNPLGLDGLFPEDAANAIISVLDEVNQRAAA